MHRLLALLPWDARPLLLVAGGALGWIWTLVQLLVHGGDAYVGEILTVFGGMCAAFFVLWFMTGMQGSPWSHERSHAYRTLVVAVGWALLLGLVAFSVPSWLAGAPTPPFPVGGAMVLGTMVGFVFLFATAFFSTAHPLPFADLLWGWAAGTADPEDLRHAMIDSVQYRRMLHPDMVGHGLTVLLHPPASQHTATTVGTAWWIVVHRHGLPQAPRGVQGQHPLERAVARDVVRALRGRQHPPRTAFDRIRADLAPPSAHQRLAAAARLASPHRRR